MHMCSLYTNEIFLRNNPKKRPGKAISNQPTKHTYKVYVCLCVCVCVCVFFFFEGVQFSNVAKMAMINRKI